MSLLERVRRGWHGYQKPPKPYKESRSWGQRVQDGLVFAVAGDTGYVLNMSLVRADACLSIGSKQGRCQIAYTEFDGESAPRFMLGADPLPAGEVAQ